MSELIEEGEGWIKFHGVDAARRLAIRLAAAPPAPSGVEVERTVEQRAWQIVHNTLPAWWNTYWRENPNSKVGEQGLRESACHACVVAALTPSPRVRSEGEPVETAAERIERLAQWLHDESGDDRAFSGYSWPLHDRDTGQRGDKAFVRLVPVDVLETFRDIARRLLRPFPDVLAPAPQERAGDTPSRGGPVADGRAKVQDGRVVVAIEISALPLIVSGSIAERNLECSFKVTDPAAFAPEVCRALNDEDERGNTLVHCMFDKAFDAAFEGGAEGVEECTEEECETEAERLRADRDAHPTPSIEPAGDPSEKMLADLTDESAPALAAYSPTALLNTPHDEVREKVQTVAGIVVSKWEAFFERQQMAKDSHDELSEDTRYRLMDETEAAIATLVTSQARAETEASNARWRDNLQNAWSALSMVREAVELFAPAVSLPSEEAVLGLHGPEPVHEATVLVEGIVAIHDALAAETERADRATAAIARMERTMDVAEEANDRMSVELATAERAGMERALAAVAQLYKPEICAYTKDYAAAMCDALSSIRAAMEENGK